MFQEKVNVVAFPK